MRFFFIQQKEWWNYLLLWSPSHIDNCSLILGSILWMMIFFFGNSLLPFTEIKNLTSVANNDIHTVFRYAYIHLSVK